MAGASIGIIWRSPRLRALFPALFVLFAGWLLAFSYIGVTVKTLYQGNPADLGTVTGVVVGLGGAVTLILSPTVGALADRYGRWRVLFAALGLEVLLWPLPALAPDMVTFTLTWAALSGVAASVGALAFGVLTASTTPEVRGRVMSFAYLPNNLGFLFGAALGGVLTTRFGVLIVFPVSAVLTLCGIAALAFAHRQPVTSNEQRAMSNESSVEVPVGAGSGKE